jgi:hypothetical protein
MAFPFMSGCSRDVESCDVALAVGEISGCGRQGGNSTPLEKVSGLLVVANCEPLNASLGLVRRDVLASSSATQPVYS